jgi:sugar lactone lactonase YvrE
MKCIYDRIHTASLSHVSVACGPESRLAAKSSFLLRKFAQTKLWDQQRRLQTFLYLASTVILLLCCVCAPRLWAVQTLTFNGVSTVLSTGTITLDAPVGIAVDPSFNVYVADTQVNTTPPNVGRITKIAQNGTSSQLTISGLTLSSAPKQIAVDGSGNLYVADAGNSRIVIINPATGAASVLSTGSITLSIPEGVALDAAGDIFIADTGNSRIVEVPAAGAAAAYTISGLTAPTSLSSPEGIAVDLSGNLYIADAGNSRVVKVTPSGIGAGAGTALAITGTTPTTPVSVAVNSFGTLYVADSSSSRIVTVSTSLVGTNFSNAHTLTNDSPAGVAIDLAGNVYVADTGNSAVDWVQTNSVGFGHNQLGEITAENFSLIIGQTAGPDLTNLFITSYGNTNLDFTSGGTTTCSSGTANQTTCIIGVQYIPASPGYRQGGMILTYTDNSIAPSVDRSITVPVYAFNDAPQAALYPGITSVLSAGSVATQTPYSVAVDGSGNVYVGNAASNNVVEIPASGSASVLSTGSFTLGNVNGLVVDGAGDRIIADNQNNLIYEINAANSVFQLSIDVGGSPVTLSSPTALATDGFGDLFIADSGNNRILKVALEDPTLTTTFPMTAIVVNTGGYTFNGITGLAVDSMENLYAVDHTNSRIVKITGAGVSSIVSFPGFTLNNPEGIALDGMGNIYVTDSGNNRVLQLTTAGTVSQIQLQGLTNPATLGGGANNHLYGLTVDSSGNIYIADTTNNRVVKVNVSEASLSFASTKQGETSTDSPQTATVLNLGDQALIFSANPTYPANFVENQGDTNPCTSTTSLSGGVSCDISVNFVPQTVGSLSQNITISDNSLNATNGSTQLVVVKGTGLIAADSTAVAVTASPSPATDGQAVTITATVTDTAAGSTNEVPTGSVTFTDTVGSTSTPLNSGSAVTLSGGVATLAGVVLSGTGTHTIAANYGGVSGSFATAGNTTAEVVNKASAVVAGPAMQPVSILDGQTGAIAVTVTGPYTTISAPSGTLSYSISNSTGSGVSSGTPTLTAGSGSSSASIPVANTLPPGSYTVSITYSGDSNYSVSSSATTISLTVVGLTANIVLISSSNPAQPGSSVTFTATLAATSGTPTGSVSFYDGATTLGKAPLSGASASYTTASLAVGTHSITAIYSGDTNFSPATSTALQESVGKVGATVALASSLNPALLTSAITFTATLAATSGTPTGSVSFYDGATLLSNVALTGLQAVYITSALAAGTHSITAIYSGDNSFATATSTALSELVQDFTISTPTSGGTSTPTATVVPGGTATYTLNIGPTVGTVFPAPVTLSLSGLPSGATGTLTPSTLPAGSSLTSVTLTIQLPQTAALHEAPQHNLRLAGTFSLALLCLPFASRMRKSAKGISRLTCLLFLVVLAGGAMAGLSGCGAKDTGYFGQQAQTYQISIIATSGSIQHSTTVTLNVE